MLRVRHALPPARVNVLSLGAGVQSTAIALLSNDGELPPLDCAVFADTGWELPETYRVVEYLAQECRFPVVTVSAGSARKDLEEGTDHLPLYTPGGGMMRRQCTDIYKVRPVEWYIRRELLGLRKGERATLGSVNVWLGISTDEIRRVKVSRKAWMRNVYPLLPWPVGNLEEGWFRETCVGYLSWRVPHLAVPSSSCVGCPYHRDPEWRYIREKHPKLFAELEEMEPGLEERGLFFRRDREPLGTTPAHELESYDGGLFGKADECTGWCGS